MASRAAPDIDPIVLETALRRRLARRDFLRLSAFGATATFLAACSTSTAASSAPSAAPASSAPAPASTAPSPSPDITGVTLDVIALDGEDGKAELESWRTEHQITLATTPIASWDEAFAKLKTDEFDIALVANPYVAQWGKAGVLQPIDTTRLSNWNDMYPALREADFLRDGGNVYAVPVAWGDGPYIYNPAKVPTPPTSVMELLDPAWKGRLIMFDDPIMPFHTIAVAKGFSTGSEPITKDQLAQVAEESRKIVANTVAFAQGYQDATDYLVRGEADLAVSGWEAMVNWAKDKGTTLAFAFLDEAHGGGWCDSWGIPVNAKDIDAAYAAIDAMIGPDVNAQVATNLVSGTVNSKAIDKVAPEAKIYDYSIVESSTSAIKFESWTPPLEATGDIATKADWDAAWQEIRAGA